MQWACSGKDQECQGDRDGPQGANLVIVKVETTEPGLYGIGCATFTQRAEVVVTAINSYERFLRG